MALPSSAGVWPLRCVGCGIRLVISVAQKQRSVDRPVRASFDKLTLVPNQQGNLVREGLQASSRSLARRSGTYWLASTVPLCRRQPLPSLPSSSR